MDFDLTPEQSAIAEAARAVLSTRCTPETLRAFERRRTAPGHDPASGHDTGTWEALAAAGVSAATVPESLGGAGLGLLEACLVLEEAGRTAAAVPLAPTLVAGLVLSAFGAGPAGDLLPGVASGQAVIAIGLAGGVGGPFAPSLRSTAVHGGWVLEGVLDNVVAGCDATAALVGAHTDEGPRLFVVDLAASGVEREAQSTTSGRTEARVRFRDHRLDGSRLLGAERLGEQAFAAAVDAVTVACCAEMAGVVSAAVRLTGTYVNEREQFGRSLASFQAVNQRTADAVIDSQAVRLTMMQAAWRIDAGLSADREVAVAKFFAAEAGQRVVHAATHLHGGMGVDRDYPLHRYFLRAKELELSLGGAQRQLLRLGRILADEGPTR